MTPLPAGWTIAACLAFSVLVWAALWLLFGGWFLLGFVAGLASALGLFVVLSAIVRETWDAR